MNAVRVAGALILLATFGWLLFLAIAPPRPDRPPSGGPAPAVPTKAVSPPSPPAASTGSSIESLRVALRADRKALLAAARDLRRALAADPSLLDRAALLLADPHADPDLRRAIAAVLGSLPQDLGKSALLEVLRSGAAAGIERAVILALGVREIEDGDVFERDGQPFGEEVAPGLVVLVSGPLADGAAREELARRLGEGAEAGDRWAAARVLRDSTAFAEVRRALIDRARLDSDPATVAEAAAAMGAWTRDVPVEDAERLFVMEALFGAAARSGEVVRLRLAAPLSSTTLAAADVGRIHELAVHGEADVRSFAAELLGRRLGLSPDEDARAVPALARSLHGDSSAEVREAAALSLGRGVASPAAVEALASALRDDADWEVRAAAARSLGRAPGSEAARAILKAAAFSDPHETVRTAAQRALAAFK